jgi:hypothetical protein
MIRLLSTKKLSHIRIFSMKLGVCLVVGGYWAPQAHADQRNQWNGPTTITNVRSGTGGDSSKDALPIYTFSPIKTTVAEGCSSSDVYSLPATSSALKPMVATLLAAQLSGKNIYYFVAGCDARNGRPQVTDVYLAN